VQLTETFNAMILNVSISGNNWGFKEGYCQLVPVPVAMSTTLHIQVIPLLHLI